MKNKSFPKIQNEKRRIAFKLLTKRVSGISIDQIHSDTMNRMVSESVFMAEELIEQTQ